MTKRKRPEAEKKATRMRTRANKIKAVEKALLTAGGSMVKTLKDRLEYWKTQKI